MRKLNIRELRLLGILFLLFLAAIYILSFYKPMTNRQEEGLRQIENCKKEIENSKEKSEETVRMEQEVETMLSSPNPPLYIPDYDNLQPVMVELHRILSKTQNYRLTFNAVSTREYLACRKISMSFSCDSYERARKTLNEIHDMKYRCLIDSLDMSFSSSDNDVSVNGTVLFFEIYNDFVESADTLDSTVKAK